MSARWQWCNVNDGAQFFFKHPLGVIEITKNKRIAPTAGSFEQLVNDTFILAFPSADFAKLAAENLFAFDRATMTQADREFGQPIMDTREVKHERRSQRPGRIDRARK